MVETIQKLKSGVTEEHLLERGDRIFCQIYIGVNRSYRCLY